MALDTFTDEGQSAVLGVTWPASRRLHPTGSVVCPPKLRVRVGLKEGDVVMVGLVDLVKLLFVERRIIVPTNNPSRAAWPWEPAMLKGGREMGWGR